MSEPTITEEPQTEQDYESSVADNFDKYMAGGEEAAPEAKPEPEEAETKPEPEEAEKDAETETPEPEKDSETSKVPEMPAEEEFKAPKELRDAYKRTKASLAEAQAALEAAKASKPAAEDNEELTNLRNANKELLEKFKRANLEASPEFKNHFDSQEKPLLDYVKTIVGDDADKVTQILKMPEGELRSSLLEDATEELSNYKKAKLANVDQQLGVLALKREAELAKADDTLAFMAQQKAEQAEANRAAMEEAFKSEWSKASTSLDPEREQFAKTVFTGEALTPEDRAKAAIWAAHAPKYAEKVVELQDQLDAANAKLSKIDAASPAPGKDQDPADETPAKAKKRVLRDDISPEQQDYEGLLERAGNVDFNRPI